ncbi:MAG TPA: PaaI family thioesterase [Acidimicrobiia bacterium]|nr:PaaI family thioesterase [Acidimicrobiia bacterium]
MGRVQIPPNCDLTLGLVCLDKSTPGRTVWAMRAHERFANPAGVTQGGFLAALADSAMSTAAVTFLEGRRASVANVEMKVSFLAPARTGSTLTATATVVRGGRRVAFLETEIVDDAGTAVLRGSSTYVYGEAS